MKRIILPFIVLIVITLVACGDDDVAEAGYEILSPIESIAYEDATLSALSSFNGTWQGSIVPANWWMPQDESVWALNIDADADDVLFSAEIAGIEFFPVNWTVSGNRILIHSDNAPLMGRLSLDLNLSDDGQTLIGSNAHYNVRTDVSFTKISDTPLRGVFTIGGHEPVDFEGRMQQLNHFAQFESGGEAISFTYDLGRRDLYADLIERFGLDAVTYGLYDVELMIALLNWVCDNFLHDGMSEMPVNRDAISIIEFLDENPRGINCRGLAILLAELLRLYGVEAKHITGWPMEHPAQFVHVVTHAYSRNLQQWIMLDPTFRIYLTDAYGTYLDIPALREAFARGDELFSNENAGRNNQPFDMANYKAFMADYMFRFSVGTHFGFGAEDGREGNLQNMLAPVGYYQDPNVTTHSSDAFWARP